MTDIFDILDYFFRGTSCEIFMCSEDNHYKARFGSGLVIPLTGDWGGEKSGETLMMVITDQITKLRELKDLSFEYNGKSNLEIFAREGQKFQNLKSILNELGIGK